MKKVLLILVLGFTIVGFSQTTEIPDPNFEQALIDLGYDTAPINGSVPTANISSVTDLTLPALNIADLTGIEDFTDLIYLNLYNNQLTSLDVRNGNNQYFLNFTSTNNPDLICIFVDDADWSTTNWTNIDPASTFVENEAECALSMGDNAFELDVTIYPNPTDNYLFIEGNKNPISISIYNLLGAEVITKSNTNKIDVSELSNGVYIIKISDGVSQIDRKFIKN